MRCARLGKVLEAALALAAGLGLAGAQPAPKGECVDLDHSFQIPQANGKSISHTPALVFTADGKRTLVATADKELIVFDAATRELLKRHRLAEKATDAVSVDRKGRVAAWVLEGGGIAVLDAESGKIIARDDKAGAKWLALDPTGKRLAFSRGGVLEVRLLDDLAREKVHEAVKGEITNVAWSPDGSLVAATAADGMLVVLNVSSGKVEYETKKPGALYALDFHPSGGVIAFGGHERKVYQLDLKTREEKVLSGNQPYWITCLGYSRDGKMIAAGDESCDVWLYKTAEPQKPAFHSKHHVECWLSQVAWSADNETFLFGCRPNSLAGKPALYAPLAQAEAARSGQVRKSRATLLASIEAELKTAKDEKARASLEQVRTALNNEEKLQGGPALANVQQLDYTQVDGPVGQAPALNLGVQQLRSGPQAIDMRSLPKSIQDLLKSHQATHRDAQEKLKASFNVNQWRVQKE